MMGIVGSVLKNISNYVGQKIQELDPVYVAKRDFNSEVFIRFKQEYGYDYGSNRLGCIAGLLVVAFIGNLFVMAYRYLDRRPLDSNIAWLIGIVVLFILLGFVDKAQDKRDSKRFSELEKRMQIQFNIHSDADYLRWHQNRT